MDDVQPKNEILSDNCKLLRMAIYYESGEFIKNNQNKYIKKADMNKALRKHINSTFKQDGEKIFDLRLGILDDCD